MTALGWWAVGVSLFAAAWAWLHNYGLRDALSRAECRVAELEATARLWSARVATDAAVLEASAGEALAWKTAHRYAESNRAQSKGMKRLARRARRAKRLEAEAALAKAYLATAEKSVIYGMYEEEVPQFQQGGPGHEMLKPVTAEDAKAWVARIRQLEKLIPAPPPTLELQPGTVVCAGAGGAAVPFTAETFAGQTTLGPV